MALRLARAAALLLPLAPPAAVPAEELRPAFRELLARYARGERAAAVGALGDWDEKDLRRQFRLVREMALGAERCPECSVARELERLPLRAAVLLHSDRDEAERRSTEAAEQPRLCPGPLARLAADYAGLLARQPAGREFARRFLLLLALRCQWDYCLEEGVAWGREGLRAFPGDPELLVAVASIHEEGAAYGTPTGPAQPAAPGSAGVRPDARAQLREARRLFEAALERDPGLALARLRLGRVLFRLGEPEAARAALDRALLGEPGRLVAFLGRLFLGQLDEEGGRLDDAIARYRSARELDPRSQSAAVALSNALLLRGDTAAARDALAAGLAQAGRRDRHDPWSEYLVANALGLLELAEALRAESLR